MTIGAGAIPVTSCDDLKWISDHRSDYQDKNMVQTHDIDCNEDTIHTLFTYENPFSGTYDGQGYTVSNFSVDDGDNSSLFGYLSGATIKNLDVNGSIYGGDCIGAIAGYAVDSNFTNNTSEAYLSTNGTGTGGIVGCLETTMGTVNVTGNTFSNTIYGDTGHSYDIGGIIGKLRSDGDSVLNISDNYANNVTTGTYNNSYYVGGIVGDFRSYDTANVKINNNKIEANIHNVAADAGGVIGYGYSYGDSKTSVDNNTVTNNTVSTTWGDTGGVIGYYEIGENAVMSSNNNSTDVNSYVDAGGSECGGIMGYLDSYGSSKATVSDNSVNSNINCNGNYYIGGVIGYAYLDADPAAGVNLTSSGNTVNSLVSGREEVGGVVGYLYSYSSSNINNNLIQGEIYSNRGYYIGGVVGYVEDYTDYDAPTFTNINGNVVNSYINGANEDSGGVVGYYYAENYNNVPSGKVVNIKNNDVQGNTSADSYAGGLIGGGDFYDETNTNALDVNLNSNNISGNVHTNWDSVGGLMGYVYNYHNNLNVNDNIITTSNIRTDHGSYVGGIIGHVYNSQKVALQINRNNVDAYAVNALENGYSGGVLGSLQSYNNSTTTIQSNINSTQNMTSNGYTGGMIGQIDNQDSAITILQNLNETNILVYGDNVGGMIGFMYNNAYNNDFDVNISQNINRGHITANNSNSGGMVGYLDTASYSYSVSTNIHDNYNAANITSHTNTSGGIMGGLHIYSSGNDGVYTTVDFARNYTSGAVTADNQYAGGILGYFNNTSDNLNTIVNIDNSFATGGAINAGSNSGSIVGGIEAPESSANISAVGLYYDQTATTKDVCNTGPYTLDNCTAVNIDGSQPDYFKNNTTNPPLNTWNFVSTWGTQSSINGGLPCLQWENASCNPTGDADGDGISNALESSGPNNGDSNGDGIPDYRQSNITSLIDAVSGKYTVIQSSCSQNSAVSNQAESTATADKEFNYPAGLTAFTTTCASEGETANITYYVYGNYDPSKIVLRKYNPSTGTYTTVSDAILTNITIGGQNVLKVQYSVTDGGPYDLDGQANGVIVDPVGIATTPTVAPNTGLGSN